jgi:hypothetical protein
VPRYVLDTDTCSYYHEVLERAGASVMYASRNRNFCTVSRSLRVGVKIKRS